MSKAAKKMSAAPQQITSINPQHATLAINLIEVNKEWNSRDDHKRKTADGGYGDLATMEASMNSQGQLTPVIVRPNPAKPDTFMLVAGFRRMAVAKKLGWKTIRAEIRPVDEATAAWLNLQENEERRDLSSYEKSKAYHRQVAVYKWKIDDIAKMAGCDRSTVENHVRIMSKGTPELLAAYQLGKWRFDVVLKLAARDAATQKELIEALGNRDSRDAMDAISEFDKTGKLPGESDEEGDDEGGEASGDAPKKSFKPGKAALERAFDWAQSVGNTEAEHILGWVLGRKGYGGAKLTLGEDTFDAKAKPAKADKDE